MICGKIRCVARNPTSFVQHARRYADDKGSGLFALATRIQSTPSTRRVRLIFSTIDANLRLITGSSTLQQPPRAYKPLVISQKRILSTKSFTASIQPMNLPEGWRYFPPNKVSSNLPPRTSFNHHEKPYNPYDFQPANRLPSPNRRMIEPLGPSRPLAIRGDVFYQLGINPLDEVLNCNLISSFTTDMGRIQKRNETKLTWKSQRKIGKAIRRARAMGLIPAFSRWEDSMIKS